MKITAIISMTEEIPDEDVNMELFLADKSNNFAQAKESAMNALDECFVTTNTLIDFIVEE